MGLGAPRRQRLRPSGATARAAPPPRSSNADAFGAAPEPLAPAPPALVLPSPPADDAALMAEDEAPLRGAPTTAAPPRRPAPPVDPEAEAAAAALAAAAADDSDEAELAVEAAAVSAPGALAALLTAARALPWSSFDTPARRLQEASKLLSRLSRAPAAVADDAGEDDDDDDELGGSATGSAEAAASAAAAARAAAAGGAPLPVVSCDDARAAVALLLLLARELPAAQVGPQVARRLARCTGAGALFDFAACSPCARAIALRGCFRLLRRLALRGASLADAAGGVNDCLAALATEAVALHAWRADLRSPPGAVGSLQLPAAYTAAQRRDAVEERLEDDTALLAASLRYLAAAMRTHGRAPGAGALLRGELLSRLLDGGCGAADAQLRRAALEVSRAAARPLRPPPCPDLDSDMEDAAYSAALAAWSSAAEACRATERGWAAQLGSGVTPALLQLLEADYPSRARAPAPGTAAPALPSRLAGGSGCEAAVVRALGDVLAAGLRAPSGLTWHAVEAVALAPHAPGDFWRRAGPTPRLLAARLLAAVVAALPPAHPAPDAPALLRAWLLAVGDHRHSRARAAVEAAQALTAALARCAATALLFASEAAAALHAPPPADARRVASWERRRVDAVEAVARAAAEVPVAAAAAVAWAPVLIEAVDTRCALIPAAAGAHRSISR